MSESDRNLAPSLLDRYGVQVRLSPLLGIFLTVFIDLLSFGLFIPDIQLRGRELVTAQFPDATKPQIGLLVGITLGVFSLAQLIAAPILGRISDRHGRRRVLLVTTVLSVVSYLIYAHAVAWPVILASRIVSGIAGANLPVAFAYIADVTKPKDRAKGLGMIGAAFGLGFILGPVAGVFLLQLGQNKPLLMGYVGATLALVNFLYVLFVLPESLRHEPSQGRLIENYRRAFGTPGLALLLVLFFATNFAFTNLETTFLQLLADPHSIFHLGDNAARQTGGYIMGVVGIVGAFMQGFMIRRLTPKVGEVKLLRAAYWLLAPALALVPFAPLWVPMLLVISLLGVGQGLAQPSLSSLISRNAPRDMQGGIFGITQGLGALARFSAPLLSNVLFNYRPSYPYLFGAALLVFPAFGVWRLRQPAAEE